MLPDSPLITVDAAPGIELALGVHGPGSEPPHGAPPVLLLHGLSQQRWFWDPVVRRMSTRPVAALDQRGHGDSDTPVDADYSVRACADDVVAALDALGWSRAVVVGHSWGAWVAAAAGAAHPDRVAAAVLVDGGLWSTAGLGPRAEIRRRLTPPQLAVPEEVLWEMVRGGDLGPSWSQEVKDALTPTFTTAEDGTVRTRLGLDRHMRVLDGLLDHDPERDLDRCESASVPVWGVVCEPRSPEGADAELWSAAKRDGSERAALRTNCVIHRWPGAVHDVPLQWPALVAGLVDTVVESLEVGER